ncbi:hypothetical protein CFIMG_007787RA00001 [Ceratocystis fimbriata CBS 114723]|uniref:Uncharacterized protein n=1 Tax=Ceratocystis fimbriata CBS 114723 TaxID=1035309 RepID=A0A2C5XDK3_9PEZI|nr:hypothetical protein CFIMG_007787RA00001 [Ceratocystis fimbriata CBS 114723]
MSPSQTRLMESCSSSIVNLTPRASENDAVIYDDVLKLRWDVVAELVTVVSVSAHDSDSHELEGILKTVELTVIEESKGKKMKRNNNNRVT